MVSWKCLVTWIKSKYVFNESEALLNVPGTVRVFSADSLFHSLFQTPLYKQYNLQCKTILCTIIYTTYSSRGSWFCLCLHHAGLYVSLFDPNSRVQNHNAWGRLVGSSLTTHHRLRLYMYDIVLVSYNYCKHGVPARGNTTGYRGTRKHTRGHEHCRHRMLFTVNQADTSLMHACHRMIEDTVLLASCSSDAIVAI